MGLVEILLLRYRRGFLDAVGVIQQHAEVADAADAGFRTHRRLAHLDARVAEDAFLGFARLPVVVDLLVRAGGDAHAPASALVLVDQNDAVLLALVDGTARARSDAGRVEAVFAEPRQVHHEGLFERAVDLSLHALEIAVLAALRELGAKDLLPVRAPLDLLHALAADQRARAGGGLVLALRRLVQVLVVEIKGFVVVVDLRQVGVGEDLRQQAQAAAGLQRDLAVAAAHPAAVPLLLVLPFLRVADAGLGLDVVEPGVLDALAAGPDVLAGDGAGVATDAFVEVEHHRDLGTDFHHTTSFFAATGTGSPSCHSTLSILRTTTSSSRLVPTVP